MRVPSPGSQSIVLQMTASVAALALAAAVSAQAAGDGPKSPYPPVQLKEAPTEACGFSRISVGPSGNEIAAWGNEREHLLAGRSPPPFALLAVGRMYDRGSGRPDRLLFHYGPDLTVPIRWAPEGRMLYARATLDRIVAIDSESGRVEERGWLDPAWKYVDLRATTHGDLSALEDPDLLVQAKRVGTDFYRGHVTLGDRATFLGARTGNLDLTRSGPGPAAPRQLRASYTRWILGFPDDRDFEGGIAYVGAEDRDRTRYLPYQRPLVDLATGRVEGKYNGREILLRRQGPFAAALAQLRRKLATGGVILDASLSGETLAVLTRSGRGEVEISRLTARGLTGKPLCTVWLRLSDTPAGAALAPGLNVKVRIFGIDSAGREAYAPGLPIATVYRAGASPAPDAPALDAIVSFNGGPTGSLADQYMPMPGLRMLAPGRDLIAVDYSGSVGGGLELTRRLTNGGMKAIGEDVEAIVKWLDRRGYRRIFLEGGSFGGIPALIALSRHPSRFSAAFMPAPLLRLRDPGDWAPKGDFQRLDSAGQLAFEEAIFGGAAGRDRFALDLRRLVAQAPYRPADRFIFSRHDGRSQPADLPAGHRARVRMTGGPHAMVSSRDTYLEEVIAAIEQAPQSASSAKLPASQPGR